MTLLTLIESAASYTAVAAIGTIGIIVFGAISMRILKNGMHHA